MNHRNTRILALSAVMLTACGGTIDIGNNVDPSGTGASTTGDGPESGGAQSQGTGGGSNGATVDVSQLRRGGYAGGFNVLGPDGQKQDGHQLAEQCRQSGGKSYNTGWFDEGECSVGSLCGDPCSADDQCPRLEGESEPYCQKDPGVAGGHCVHGCESNSDCPGGMVCEQTQVTEFAGRICLIEDVAWAPQCDGFCMDSEAHDDFGVDCQSDGDCCSGLVCGSEGNCESAAGSVQPEELRTGGYGGGFNVFGPEGEEVGGHELTQECLGDGGYPLWSWDEEECRAASVCALQVCTEDSDCPSMANASTPRCLEMASGNTQVCVHTCEKEEDCGGTLLTCAQDRNSDEKVCMTKAVPSAETCRAVWEDESSD